MNIQWAPQHTEQNKKNSAIGMRAFVYLRCLSPSSGRFWMHFVLRNAQRNISLSVKLGKDDAEGQQRHGVGFHNGSWERAVGCF